MSEENNQNNNSNYKDVYIIAALIIAIALIASAIISGNQTAFLASNTDQDGNLLINVTNTDPRVEIPLDVFAARVIGAPTTLANNSFVDSYQLNVTGGSWIAGDMLQVNSGTGRSYRGEVISVAGSILTMDRPLDFDFLAGNTVLEIDENMAVDGSVTPVIFQVGPVGEDTEAFVSRIIFHCVDDSAMDDTKFCGGPALTRGVQMRYGNGEKFNIINIKNNGDWRKFAFDIDYPDKVGGGNYAVGSRLTWGGESKQGTFLYISNTTILEFIVQDDMTGYLDTTITVEGFSRQLN